MLGNIYFHARESVYSYLLSLFSMEVTSPLRSRMSPQKCERGLGESLGGGTRGAQRGRDTLDFGLETQTIPGNANG